MPISERKCGLRQLRNGEHVIADAIGCTGRIEDLHVQNTIYTNLHVVVGDTNLLGNVDGLFLENVPVRNSVDERKQNMEAGIELSIEFTEPLNNVCVLLRHNYSRLEEDDDDY